MIFKLTDAESEKFLPLHMLDGAQIQDTYRKIAIRSRGFYFFQWVIAAASIQGRRLIKSG